jgi:hypothetical protein
MLLLACPPKTVDVVEVLDEVVDEPVVVAPVIPVEPVVLSGVEVPALPVDPGGQLELNLWRQHYNQAITLANAGELASAVDEALSAVATAPGPARAEALELLAVRAEEAGEMGVEFAALDALLELEAGQWAVFWNGMTDAMEVREHQRAWHYAERAVALCPDPEERTPMLAWAALDAGQLDRAVEVAATVEEGHTVRSDVAFELAALGRCEEARALDPSKCPE